MNRLTERDEYGNADIIGVDSADLQLNLDFDGLNRVTDALNRLAAYEDAEQEGRLIVLPCKPGTEVYHVFPVQGIRECWIRRFQIGRYGLLAVTKYGCFSPEDFGKTVFLTRQEAEAALGGGGDG